MQFPISGVECSPLVPPLVAFAIASLVTSAGVSGAFLLLPFQISVLGYVSPGVSPTNLIYNIVATPGGVYGYIRERRMAWPLAMVTLVGTLPGLLAGAIIRIRYLPDPRAMKVFAGCVLLYLGCRLVFQSGDRAAGRMGHTPLPPEAVVRTRSISWKRIEYEFRREIFSFRPVPLLLLSLLVGLVGGVYGVGGGAVIAPFLASQFGLPVYTIAGATLFGTFATSVAGVAFFEILGLTPLSAGMNVSPDWALGALFGVGGLFGTYVGARLQRFLPERWIRLLLGVLVSGVALSYLGQLFFR